MSWLNIDDGFMQHPKILGLSDRAFRLHMAGLCYCARNLTDGVISRLELRSVGSNANLSRPGSTASMLIRAGLWVKKDESYYIHDYLVYNRSKLEIERDRAEARERMRRIRSGERSANRFPARSGARSGTHSLPLVSDNQNRSEATWQPAFGVRDPLKAIRAMIHNGAIVDEVTLDAELRAQGLNGDDEAALKAELATVAGQSLELFPEDAGPPDPEPSDDWSSQ